MIISKKPTDNKPEIIDNQTLRLYPNLNTKAACWVSWGMAITIQQQQHEILQ